MDRVQLKMDAKAAMQQANPHPVLVALVYMVILAAISFVISMMSGVSSVFTTLVSNPDAAAAIYAGMMIPSILLSLVSTLVTGFLNMGFTAYTLRVINRQPAGINDLFAYARYCLKIWGLSIVMGFFVFAWSLLLWVPGIIAMYRYSQAVYIFAENPDKGIMECINESKAMMYGHKMDKFVLDLSFILWYLLAGVTCGIAGLYVTPYVEITNAAFYNSLKMCIRDRLCVFLSSAFHNSHIFRRKGFLYDLFQDGRGRRRISRGLDDAAVSRGNGSCRRLKGEHERIIPGRHHQRHTIGFLHNIASVSYTHLDVYKRQAES